jgi:hypothetical protein
VLASDTPVDLLVFEFFFLVHLFAYYTSFIKSVSARSTFISVGKSCK